MQLRPYQTQAIDNLRRGFSRGYRRIVLQAATGSGKTLTAVEAIRSAVEKNKRCLFVAHRKEIIEQTSRKLSEIGLEHGIIMADNPNYRPQLPVQVASIQTLSRRYKPKADLLIIDECHLSVSKSFTDLIESYPDAAVIGLTATPIRLDGKGLGQIYQHMVSVIPVAELIEQGHLVNPRVFAPFHPDLSKVVTVRGDFDQAQIAETMDKTGITGDIVKHWQLLASERKTICFAASVQHSIHIRDAFLKAGIKAEHLDATTNHYQRARILNDWRAGKFQVLSNCGLFIEGLDVPEASCCILGRPTQSLTIYLQSVGRVMRPAPGKQDCIILDHAGLTYAHGMIDEDREWSLEGAKKRGKKKQDDQQAASVTTCEACFAAYSRIKHGSCPQCGTENAKRKQSEYEVSGEGALAEIDRDALARRRKQELKAARTKDDLVTLGRSRGYRFPAQWADHILKGRQQYLERAHG